MAAARCPLHVDPIRCSEKGNYAPSFGSPETHYVCLTLGISLPTDHHPGLFAGLPRQEIRQSGYGFNRLGKEDELVTGGLGEDFIPNKFPFRICDPSMQLDTLS